MRTLLTGVCLLVLTGTAVAQEPVAMPDPGEAQREVLTVLGWVAGGLAVLFFPFGIAVLRGHHNALAIGALCFFLGWTIIGWIVAMIWSLTGNTHAAEYRRYRR
jgi:ABC-type transport system involved in cytochrome c biogenesis permease component